jgi:hypothetical protein
LVALVRDPQVVARCAALTVGVALVLAACTSQPSQSRSPRARPSRTSAIVHRLPTGLLQQSERFVHLSSAANPDAVMILTSSRNLRPGQRGVVLTVRSVGNLVGSCVTPGPAVTIRLTYRGAGPPVDTQTRVALARPASLHLLEPYLPLAPSPAGGKQRFAFFQVVAGGEAADFSLAVWATLTPVPGGCAFTTNGVLRVRCTAFAEQICSYIARQGAWPHLG